MDSEANNIFAAAQASHRPASRLRPYEKIALRSVKAKHPGIDLKAVSSLYTSSKNPLPALPLEIQGDIMRYVGYHGKLSDPKSPLTTLGAERREATRAVLAERNATTAHIKKLQASEFRQEAERRIAREKEAIDNWEEELRQEAEERSAKIAKQATMARELARAKSRKRRGKSSSKSKSATRKN